MQIDFHHTVTYVAARFAKFSIEDANKISYAAQYVDDAINSGVIRFRNKAMYSRISSAHTMLDYRNFEELANHLTWIPFHFLPGNGKAKAGDNPDGGFIKKLVCTPDSYVANDMVKSCIACHDRPYGLHRLGITMHVLADTFAHQGFAGINNEINDVSDSEDLGEEPVSLVGKLKDYFGDLFDRTANKVISNAFPLGHGAALTFPDMPYLDWEYKDGTDKLVSRNNTDFFMDAVIRMHEIMVKYRMKNPNYPITEDESIPKNDQDKIRDNFLSFKDEDGDDRHDKWIASINNGDFSFSEDDEKIDRYIPKGKDSWKHKAIDTKKEVETGFERYPFKETFLDSDWKHFHDALQIHRIDVIRNILPNYGICVA